MRTREFEDSTGLTEFLNSLPNHYIYRGHSNALWQLEPNLERTLGKGWSYERARRFEEASLLRFQAKFHLYDRENNEPKSKLSWLSMMQHYGVPTRLLDFTESPYVALYFALESYEAGTSDDFALYAIDFRSLLVANLQYMKQKGGCVDETQTSIYGRQDEVFDAICDASYDIAWATEPAKLNTRMDRQSGCFLISINLGNRLEDVLESGLYEECDIVKCTISGLSYKSVYDLLKKMNLNASVIYGDLTGLARSIRMEQQAYALQ